jgi:hypothetical protein
MTAVKRPIIASKSLGLNPPPMLACAQKANSTYVRGAPVYLDTNGYLAATGVDTVGSDSCVKAAASAKIVGFVAEAGAASSSDTTAVAYHAAIEAQLFEGNLIDGTASSNAHTLAQTDVGGAYGLCKPTGETHYGVDAGAASSRDCVTVVDLVDAIGTVNGRVQFIVRASWRQLGA